MSKQLLQYAPGGGGGGLLPYKGLMGTCGQPGYVFQDFCLKQCIGFIIFCPNQGIDFIIFCLKQGLKGQGMRGRATPPHPRIYRVPPPGSTRTLVWILFFPLFRTFLVNVSQSRGLAVPPRRGTCRLSLVGIGQGTLVCLEIRKTNIISIFGFEGVSSFISTAPCHKSQIHLF